MPDDRDDAPPSNPLLGTSFSESTENARESSEGRSSQRAFPGNASRIRAHTAPSKPQKSAKNGRSKFPGIIPGNLPKGVTVRAGQFYYRRHVPKDVQGQIGFREFLISTPYPIRSGHFDYTEGANGVL